ncbi:MAG TPA: ATP-dependent DNA helicase RecG [Candidatus Limnocylindria bacterium]|nr:ATP-dependent DNA helicase RecG [Candidatus Limnocylindria bacterium]
MPADTTAVSARSHPRSSLDLPVRALPGVGESGEKLLGRLEIRTIGDLLWHLPRRYMDFSQFTPLRYVRAEQEQTVEAILGKVGQRRTATGKLMTEVELVDPADHAPTNIRATWFGRQFIKERFPEGQLVRISGKVRFFGRSLQFANPKIEPAAAEAVHTGRIVPIYRLTEGLKEGVLRRWLHTAVEGGPRRTAVVKEVPEPLPEAIRARRSLLGIQDALRQIHFPDTDDDNRAARRRLAFDELFILQLALGQRRARWTKEAKALPLAVDEAEIARWTRELPFVLTAAQRRALDEIRAELARSVPMSRLLEGDVGSGKTVVAALAARIAVASGAQAALMAPTELLAEQHHRSLAAIFGEHGPRVALLTSSVTGAARRETLEALASGDVDVVVGTHALVEESVGFARLALAVVDEQHRFGVRQRAIFREKGIDPHLLLTTATPIPQTLSQTIYRDLDISVLDELPSGLQRIRTEVRTSDALPKVWPWLRERISAGEQAFIVTPRIDEDPEDDVPSALATHRDLAKKELAGLRLGLLHGRMPAKERDAVMSHFASGDLDVLVATTVVEVGIDIPGATVMVILGAERFGLAQLHQLRGRVGRRGQRAFCVLVSEQAEESSRLAAMTERMRLADGTERPLNGFELAKRDLEIRGAGEFLGKRQSGESELRIVDLADADPALIDETAVEADALLAADPQLQRPEHAGLAAAVDELWRRYALA